MVIMCHGPDGNYGLEWYNQYAAWIYTAGLICLGVFIYYYNDKRKRFLKEYDVYSVYRWRLTTGSNRESWINISSDNNPLGSFPG